MPRPAVHNARAKRFPLILAAAEQQFADRGFDGVRLDDVAAAACIRRETLLHYLPTKEALFRAACGEACARFEDKVRLTALQTPPDGDRGARARACAVDVLRTDRNLARLLLRGLIEGESRPAFLPVRMIGELLGALALSSPTPTLRADVEAALLQGAGRPEWDGVWAGSVPAYHR